MTGFPAGVFATNCYLVAPAAGEECVIIDPGQDAERGIDELLDRYRLKPIAVLLTHGHVDHMWSVAPVCGAKGVPAYIHPDDRELLSDPGRGLDLLAKQQFLGNKTFAEPDDVKPLEDGGVISLAGLDFSIAHAPGHTPGSVTFRSSADDKSSSFYPYPKDFSGSAHAKKSKFAGDVLFCGDMLVAGSIGRTDLPGGDQEQLMQSLARTLSLPDEVTVLPGHGSHTTIGNERRTNPFLTGLQPAPLRSAQKGL